MSSSIRFYLDEHIPNAIAEGVRRRGIDVLTILEAGKLGASDEEHFTFARQQGRVIVTHDTDYLRLAASSSDHSGVVYAPQEQWTNKSIGRLPSFTSMSPRILRYMPTTLSGG